MNSAFRHQDVFPGLLASISDRRVWAGTGTRLSDLSRPEAVRMSRLQVNTCRTRS